MTRSLTLLNGFGDVTIVWDESSDDAIEEIVRKKMAEGVTFFIVEPVAGGLAAPRRTEVTDPAAIRERRAVVVDDADLGAFVSMGLGGLQKTEGRRKTVRKAKEPKEVAKGRSVAVKPRAGG